MQITCPHCTTSYAVDPGKFGAGGRLVRCARCQETWQARPDAAIAVRNPAYSAVGASDGAGTSWEDRSSASRWQERNPPHIESPPISGGWSAAEQDNLAGVASNDGWADEPLPAKTGKWRGAAARIANFLTPKLPALPASLRVKMPSRLDRRITLPRTIVAMTTLIVALVAWRAEVVRLMPQTAAFFKMAGLGVNLRGLAFEDVKITTETVNGKPVLVIEGAIADITRKPVELPRLRFIVRDGQGTEIYAWNSVLEQPVLNPGEKVWFKSRLASPPAEGREIAVRFFQRRDVVAGGA